MINKTLWIKCNECFIEEDVSREEAKDWICKHCQKAPTGFESYSLRELQLEYNKRHMNIIQKMQEALGNK